MLIVDCFEARGDCWSAIVGKSRTSYFSFSFLFSSHTNRSPAKREGGPYRGLPNRSPAKREALTTVFLDPRWKRGKGLGWTTTRERWLRFSVRFGVTSVGLLAFPCEAGCGEHIHEDGPVMSKSVYLSVDPRDHHIDESP